MTVSIALVTRRRLTFAAALCLAADLLLVAPTLHDRCMLGRMHRATWLAIAALLPVHVATPVLISSDW